MRNPAMLYPMFALAAWAFVVLRIVHSLIHLTYNRVLHRLTAFSAANVARSGSW